MKPIEYIKLIGARENEKMTLLQYDDEEDVEWVYNMDLEVEEEFVEPEEQGNLNYDVETIVKSIWKDYDTTL